MALAGWPEVEVSPGAWSDTDAAGRALVMTHGEGSPVPVAANEDRSVHAVLAGALYNRRELRAGLRAGHTLAGHDDAEVIVHLYEERGPQFVKALRGAFGLALWDGRRQRLLLARDQLGLVPVYYAADRSRLAVASTLPQLARLPGLATTWDAGALDAFLVLGTVPAPATLYPAIRQLQPGEVAIWQDGRLRVQRYWQLTFPERRAGRAALAGMLREQLTAALRLRQAGAVTGLLLSAGLDAAAVLALAVADRRPPVRAYTLALPDGEELNAAVQLALRAGVEHVVVSEPPDWPVAVDALLATHGGPLGGIELPALQVVARRAAADVAVALAGVGGEEVLGGSLPARAGARVRVYRRLPATIREGLEIWARLAPGQTLRHLVRDARLAPVELYARAVSCFQPEERAELYTPEALAALGEVPPPWTALGGMFAEAMVAGAEDSADAIHYVELMLRLPAHAAVVSLLVPGLEIRLPLADHRLAQLAASACAAERDHARARQPLLRAALGDLLPTALLRRPHVSPAPAPAAWTSGSLRALVEETCAPQRLAAQGIFRPEVVARLVAEHAHGQHAHGRRLWAIILATRWLDRLALPAAGTLRAAG